MQTLTSDPPRGKPSPSIAEPGNGPRPLRPPTALPGHIADVLEHAFGLRPEQLHLQDGRGRIRDTSTGYWGPAVRSPWRA